jgi:hypoxanthine phosphoribosyltransferase
MIERIHGEELSAPSSTADLFENWNSMVDASVKAAEMVESLCESSGRRFDRLAFIARGGLFPANIIARILGFDSLTCFNMSIKTYHDQEQTGLVKTAQMPSPEEIEGHRWIAVDEVVDTGVTIKYAADYLWENGAEDVLTLATHYKPGKAQAVTGFVPDVVAHTVGDSWIHYPWEALEDRGTTSLVADFETLVVSNLRLSAKVVAPGLE